MGFIKMLKTSHRPFQREETQDRRRQSNPSA